MLPCHLMLWIARWFFQVPSITSFGKWWIVPKVAPETSVWVVVGEFQPLEDSCVLSLLDSASQASCECDSQWGLRWGLSFLISHKLWGDAILVLSPHRCHGNKTLGPHWFFVNLLQKESSENNAVRFSSRPYLFYIFLKFRDNFFPALLPWLL